VEPPGGESGNIKHTCGMYNKPTGCSIPAYGAPHKQTNKQHIAHTEDAINELNVLFVSLGRGKANLKTWTSEKCVLKYVLMD
jgi:hypothetical protein